MAYKLLDDYSGEPLDRDHPHLDLRVGMQGWRLYLTDKSKDALFDALEPFTKEAEPIDVSPSPAKTSTRRGKASSSDTKAARAWAIATGYKYTNAAGEKKTLGDRGVVPDEVVQAWKDAGSPA